MIDNIVNIIPDILRRKPKRLDWLKLTVAGLKDLLSRRLIETDRLYFIAKHNYQAIVLEYFLNNYLNPQYPIEIIDEDDYLDVTYLYRREDPFPGEVRLITDSYLTTQITLHRREDILQQVDFYVKLNAADVALTPQVRYWTNYYKPNGFKFEII